MLEMSTLAAWISTAVVLMVLVVVFALYVKLIFVLFPAPTWKRRGLINHGDKWTVEVKQNDGEWELFASQTGVMWYDASGKRLPYSVESALENEINAQELFGN